MKWVDLKNPRVLDILERFRYLYREKYDLRKTNKLARSGDASCVTDEYLRKVRAMGRKHIGLPVMANSICIKPEHYRGNDLEGYSRDFNTVNNQLKTELGLDSSALSQMYPPGGFIDWHNNANAHAFNVVFTWSEKGDGWFKWLDGDEIIKMEDPKGWSCKAGYFAEYGDTRPVIYHCAYTNCWRMTLSFTLGYDENYWSDMIDYIQSED